MEKRRTFLALPLASSFEREIRAFVEKVRPESSGVKWVKPEHVHMTLYFFGPTAEADIPKISRLAEKSAEAVGPLRVGLEGVGFFPHEGKPRVVWTGLRGDTDEVIRLQKELCLLLREGGFLLEDRRFQPHVTLGRIKQPWDCRLSRSLHFEKTPDRLVDHIVYYESRLSPEGSRYEVLERFPLKGN